MDTSLIVRLIVSIVAVVNSVCAMAGMPLLDLGEDTITVLVNAAVMVGVWAYDVWKNFNFTEAAKEGQKVTDAIKSGEDITEA